MSTQSTRAMAHEQHRVCFPGADRAGSGFQPLAGAARRAVRRSLHRAGLCVQRLKPAADASCSASAIGPRATGSSPSSAGASPIAIVFLGASAALLGRWVEEGGPRRAMFTAGFCFDLGFVISALGVSEHRCG